MKKYLFSSIIVFSLALSFTPNYCVKAQVVTSHGKEEQIIESNETSTKDVLITKTVKTQKQLIAALRSSTIDIIIIKPKTATKLFIQSGNYKKDLVVYQAYTNLTNNGTFNSSNIHVTSQYQLDKAVKVNSIDTITLKTENKNTFTLSKGNVNTVLVVEAPNSNINNSVTWESITINNMSNSVWTEKGTKNNIIVKGETEGLVIDKKATVSSIVIDQTKTLKHDGINIKVDGKVNDVIVKTDTEIDLTGKNTQSFVQNISNKSTTPVIVNIGGTTVKVPSEIVTPQPTVPVTPTEPTPTESTPTESTPTVPTIPTVPMIPTVPVAPTHSHNYVGEITTAATCTEDGVKTYTCLVDGNSYTEVIPATGHTPGEWTVTKAATYSETGTKIQSCTVCGITLATEAIPELSHTHNYVGEVTLAPTCTENGVKTCSCTINGESYTETIPATGHIPGEWIVKKAATYSETGTKVQNCTVCGVTLATETIPVVPHTHNYVGEVTLAPTETSTGIMTYTCTINGETYTEVIPLLEPTTPTQPTVYNVAIESTDGHTPSSVTGRDRTDLATEVYIKVNELRAFLGLNTLSWDTTMDDYTQLRAAEVTQKFDHERPNLERGYQMNPAIASENIGVGYVTADEVMAGWISSPAHYNAMVNPDYDSIAVGCFEEQIVDVNGNPTGDYYTGWVQFFHDNEYGIIIIN